MIEAKFAKIRDLVLGVAYLSVPVAYVRDNISMISARCVLLMNSGE